MNKSLVLSLLVLGCNSPGSLPTIDAYQRASVTALCQYFARCGTISPSTEATCDSTFTSQFMSSNQAYDPNAALTAGRISYDGVAAQACVDSIAGAGCDFKSLLTLGSNGACLSFAKGRVPAGGSCKADGECQNGYCNTSSGIPQGCSGTCNPFSATGGDCATGRCAKTDYCSNSVCTRLVAQGAACSTTAPCAAGLACQGSVCQSPGGSGAACSASFLGDTCALGLFCDATQLICKPRQPAGAACTSNDACNDGLLCAAAGTAAACTPFVDLGHSCASAACAEDAACDPASHLCQPMGQAGADCTSGVCGLNLYCNATKKCAQKVPYGGACDPIENGPCVAGSCDATSKTCVLICM